MNQTGISQPKKVLFVVNPKAGKKKSLAIESVLLEKFADKLDYDILWWEKADQPIEMEIDNYINQGYNIIAAVGGDGTMNRVGAALIGKKVLFAIIPFGSGNGLARHLHIPLVPEKAISLILAAKYQVIDSCKMNNIPFFCTAGVGFDAHIGYLFATDTKRGFWRYVKIVMKELLQYKSQKYALVIDGQPEKTFRAFLVTFANANQYGNNTYIAPQADLSDGLVNITVIKKFKFYHVPSLVYKVFKGTIHTSSVVETFTGKHMVLQRKKKGHVHYDGEPGFLYHQIEISIIPNALSVIVP